MQSQPLFRKARTSLKCLLQFSVFETRIFAHKDTLDVGMAEKDLLAALLSSILNPHIIEAKVLSCKQTAILPFFCLAVTQFVRINQLQIVTAYNQSYKCLPG